MTNLQLPDSNDSKLTAYNVDGLELFFTPNRKVRASQSAIARMCSIENKVVAQAQIRQYIRKIAENGEIKIDVVSVEMKSGIASNVHLLYGSKVIVACLKRYNPERLEQFLDFGIDEGLAQLAGVPLPQPIVSPVAKSQEQQMIEMCENAIKMAKLSLAAEKYPGDRRDMLSILKGEIALDGLMTTKEMADANGLALSKHQATQIGQIMSGHLRTKNELHPIPTKRVKYRTASGNYQSYIANAYPASTMTRFLSAYAAVVGDI